MANENLLQYKLFSSFVHPSFWHKLAELKIEVDRLNENRKSISGFYSNNNSSHCLLEVDCTSFNKDFDEQTFKFQCHGSIVNKNKLEDFKQCDKKALITEEGQLIADDILSGRWLKKPSLLARFFILSYADLKSYNYYYWFAFPCPSEPLIQKTCETKSISTELLPTETDQLTKLYFDLSNDDRAFFIVVRDNGNFMHKKLSEKIKLNSAEENFATDDLSQLYFCFSDASSTENIAAWSLRLFLCALSHSSPNLCGKEIKILALRVHKAASLEKSVAFSVRMPDVVTDFLSATWIGWEPNSSGKYLPNCASMASSMDPHKLAESGVLLNLKLMKWRLLPDLNLEKIASTKCLLFGAGTLGCAVARNLVAWGVRTITFADSGYVSYSNPVRQSLYRYEDAINKRDKAKTAAERLLEICPGLTTVGHNLHIPMPGFPVGDSMKSKTKANLAKIETMIKEHDVIFLLTDSRESRWLPAVIAAANNKIVINAALGFDSYLIMRHGYNNTNCASSNTDPTVSGLKCINGNDLGCYFCNDITAPGDSQKDRTLDQQCTVTRPAVSNIAAGLAVELLIALTQAPNGPETSAYVSVAKPDENTISSIPEGPLGIIPHSIRGMISNFQQILPATERFDNCIACSQKIVNEYRTKGEEFLFKAFETSKYLEDISGISALLNAQHDEILEFDIDSDPEFDD